MSALIEKDRKKRIGAVSFESFTSHPFFAELDFEALERKEIPPVFTPSSDKTNFDATYDLEELLLEEAPLEARARRQKPRAELKDDATAKEIREDELHRIIETMFEPFDYTLVSYQGNAADAIAALKNPEDSLPLGTSAQSTHSRQYSQPESSAADNATGDGAIRDSNRELTPDALPHSPSRPSLSSSPPVQSSTSFSRPFAGSAAAQPTSPATAPPPVPRPRATNRKMSKGGGVQMVLEEAGSWSELADQSSTVPGSEGYENITSKGGKPSNSGMLAFLSRKKGRDRSPKPTEPGVLGKEGARQIIS